ncbi:uncharacterized protein LOC116029190 [Ipomoea triloba]|uniref:uncharacterized protein LOC116029190 n=1 Tax=Ipomoea triloba TaxID=35885 RepID=UPI00125E6830|nr:uncharacterized protein LOC116029190 [Ipomoea triloba]
MKFLSWNCRGIVNGWVKKHVKELLNTSKADALCLLEIRSLKAQGMINLVSRLGYTKHFLVEPLGFAGGLLLFWKHEYINLEVIGHSSQSIHTRVKIGLVDMFFTFAYVRPNLVAKKRFWDNCKVLGDNLQGPWIVIGDLNDIASGEEQWGSESTCNTSLQRFVDAYSSCGLFDPGHVGPKFTWCKTVGNRVTQMHRLDRALWNTEAQLAFPEGKTVVLPILCSDHNPILFMDAAGLPPNQNSRPRRFEAAWLTREDYGTIWKDATRIRDRSMADIITDITEQSFSWNRNVFGNIFNRKRHLEARILGIQQALSYTSLASLQALERKLIRELNDVLDQEEALWFQKSRKDWIRDGDRNTRFYHTATVIKRNRGRVRFLKIQGSWTDEPATVSNHIINYYVSLFCRLPREDGGNLAQIEPNRKITTEQANRLCGRVTIDEVKKAVFGMKKYGSPGPDGIPVIFYQHFWEEVGTVLTDMVNQALETGMVHKSLLQACMTLIPKKDTPETAADFRPITLLNVAFKVISKVLVNRMRPIMCKLIRPHQNSFLPGRSTLDNVILTQEIIHNMHKRNGKKGLMAVKIDLQKAYDSVDWEFLGDTLEGFGFPKKVIDLILFALKECDISIIWNGGRLPSFKPGRSLRQGDPLAPYLFNLVMERLAYDIHKEVSLGDWKPIRISRGRTSISHLFFADDLMLFSEATEHQANKMMECLRRLSKDSGLKVNFTKSQIFCSPNTNASTKHRIADCMGIPLSPHLDSYLGIPILNKMVSKQTFNYVIDKMRKKLAMWQADSLSMAGRRVLVQSALATIPTYTMQSMALPVSTCSEIDKICRNFLWGHSEDTRKIHIVSWAEVCKPRDEGGLGLRRARDFNMAFLTKLGWQMLTNETKLWVQVMKEKYGSNGDLLNTNKSNCSWGWRSIMKGKRPIPTYPNVQVPTNSSNVFVNQFIGRDRNWDANALADLVPESILNAIRASPIPVRDDQADTRSWSHSGNQDEEGPYGWVWKIKCTEHVKLFIWKIIHNGLLVNSERRKRGLATQGDCPNCDEGEETLDHIFRRCHVAVDCWRLVNGPARFNASSHVPLVRWIEENCTGTRGGSKNNNWSSFFPCVLWNLWKARNQFVFKSSLIPASVTYRKASQEAQEAHNILVRSFIDELWGLREGLKIAVNRGLKKLIVETDSNAMIQALSKDADSRPEADTLIADCKFLLSKIQELELAHVFREGNQCADYLANMGQDNHWGTLILNRPPDGVINILSRDAMNVATRRIR